MGSRVFRTSSLGVNPSPHCCCISSYTPPSVHTLTRPHICCRGRPERTCYKVSSLVKHPPGATRLCPNGLRGDLTLFGPHLVPLGTMSMFLLLSSSTASLHSMLCGLKDARLPLMDSPPPMQNMEPHLRFLPTNKSKVIMGLQCVVVADTQCDCA